MTVRTIKLLFITILLIGQVAAQESSPTNFYPEIKNYNLSAIIEDNDIVIDYNEQQQEKMSKEEALGFIGKDYQRFYIHFISVIQNPGNPYEYFVYGKTKVKETICSFQGTLTIRQAFISQSEEIPAFRQGVATADYIFYEDAKQKATGFFKGKLTMNFLIDNKNNCRYDAITIGADGFANNQFAGTWTSYKTGVSKICNWGDYRIPDCGDLDVGDGEFSVNKKYINNGWQSFILYNTSPEKADTQHWWE